MSPEARRLTRRRESHGGKRREAERALSWTGGAMGNRLTPHNLPSASPLFSLPSIPLSLVRFPGKQTDSQVSVKKFIRECSRYRHPEKQREGEGQARIEMGEVGLRWGFSGSLS